MKEKIVVYFDEANEYHYNCQVWKYSSGAWWYSGAGRFCTTLEEVIEYAKSKKLLLEFK